MIVLLYIAIIVLSYYIGKLDKPVQVAGISLAMPLLILTILGIVMYGVSVVLVITGIFILILLILKKLKFIIGIKLAMLCGAVAASILGIFTGPPGWLITGICIFVIWYILSSLKKMAISTYKWIFLKLGQMFIFIRKKADGLRMALPKQFQFLVALLEIPLVCGLAVNGVWKLMNKLDKIDTLTPTVILWRILVLIPFIAVLYRSYLRDTTPPQTGGGGPDLPIPIPGPTDIATNIINH